MSLQEITQRLTELNDGKPVNIKFSREGQYFIASAKVRGIRYGKWLLKNRSKEAFAESLFNYIAKDLKKGQSK